MGQVTDWGSVNVDDISLTPECVVDSTTVTPPTITTTEGPCDNNMFACQNTDMSYYCISRDLVSEKIIGFCLLFICCLLWRKNIQPKMLGVFGLFVFFHLLLSLIHSSGDSCVTSTTTVLKGRMRVCAARQPSRVTVVVGRTAVPPPTTGHASRLQRVSTLSAPPLTQTTPTLGLEKATTCGLLEILQVIKLVILRSLCTAVLGL